MSRCLLPPCFQLPAPKIMHHTQNTAVNIPWTANGTWEPFTDDCSDGWKQIHHNKLAGTRRLPLIWETHPSYRTRSSVAKTESPTCTSTAVPSTEWLLILYMYIYIFFSLQTSVQNLQVVLQHGAAGRARHGPGTLHHPDGLGRALLLHRQLHSEWRGTREAGGKQGVLWRIYRTSLVAVTINWSVWPTQDKDGQWTTAWGTLAEKNRQGGCSHVSNVIPVTLGCRHCLSYLITWNNPKAKASSNVYFCHRRIRFEAECVQRILASVGK